MPRKCDTTKYKRQRRKEIHNRNTRKQRHQARWERRQKQRKDEELWQKVNQALDHHQEIVIGADQLRDVIKGEIRGTIGAGDELG